MFDYENNYWNPHKLLEEPTRYYTNSHVKRTAVRYYFRDMVRLHFPGKGTVRWCK